MTTRLQVAVADAQRVREVELKGLIAVPRWMLVVLLACLAGFIAFAIITTEGTALWVRWAMLKFLRFLPLRMVQLVTCLLRLYLYILCLAKQVWMFFTVTLECGSFSPGEWRAKLERYLYLKLCKALFKMGVKSFKLVVLSESECRPYEERCQLVLHQWGVRLVVENLQRATSSGRRCLEVDEVLRLMSDLTKLADQVHVVKEWVEKRPVPGGKKGQTEDIHMQVNKTGDS